MHKIFPDAMFSITVRIQNHMHEYSNSRIYVINGIFLIDCAILLGDHIVGVDVGEELREWMPLPCRTEGVNEISKW